MDIINIYIYVNFMKYGNKYIIFILVIKDRCIRLVIVLEYFYFFGCII